MNEKKAIRELINMKKKRVKSFCPVMEMAMKDYNEIRDIIDNEFLKANNNERFENNLSELICQMKLKFPNMKTVCRHFNPHSVQENEIFKKWIHKNRRIVNWNELSKKQDICCPNFLKRHMMYVNWNAIFEKNPHLRKNPNYCQLYKLAYLTSRIRNGFTQYIIIY
tara:strand:- start:448 stop:945 length:498 start_codon:yes stop_codon:yes gene_type:complete